MNILTRPLNLSAKNAIFIVFSHTNKNFFIGKQTTLILNELKVIKNSSEGIIAHIHCYVVLLDFFLNVYDEILVVHLSVL